MARARGDYSDFVIGEIYPNTLVRILSEVFSKPDEISGKNRQYVKYTCTACNSGKIYDGRVDRIRCGRTCRCPECGRSSKRPEGFKDGWLQKNEITADKVNVNNLTSKHIGKIYGNWFVNAFDKTIAKGHGNSYYIVVNLVTGETKSARIDSLPHKVDNTLTNLTDTLDIVKAVFNQHDSIGETKVANWLKEHKIKFEREYSFDDLIGCGNGLLRFDFKITDKNGHIVLIEFQGQQHYEPVDFFGGEKQFKIQQLHDNLKRKYCKYHGYTLIEIPYNYKSLDDYLKNIN